MNNGTAAAAIGGYELRFYYSSEGSLDATHLVFENYQSLSMIRERNSIQCAEDRFAYKVTLAQGAQIEPQSSLPASPAHFSIHRDDWQNYSWAGIAGVALFDTQGNLVHGTEMWPCSGYTKKNLKLTVYETVHLEGMSIPNGYVNEAIGSVQLEFRNDGDTSLVGPVYVDFFVTHPSGQVPMLAKGGDTLSIAGTSLSLGGGVSVSRMSSGDRHTFRFILDGGLPASSSSTITFTLLDQCITDCPTGSENDYKWSLADDWSATDGLSAPWNPVKTEKVAIYSSTGELVYGSPDTSAPSPDVQGVVAGEVVLSLAHASLTVPAQVANRTDAIMYSMGQLLSGGDFETDWIHGWKISGTAVSVRGNSPQGSRHLELSSGANIMQDLPLQAGMLLADSGATFVFWHTGNLAIDVLKNGTSVDSRTVSGSTTWERDTVFLSKSLFDASAVYTLSITANGAANMDDAVLIPGLRVQPSTYAVRFTNPLGEDLETRAYDGAEELLITDSEHDAMGRTWRKYLPFALLCKGVADCNSERKAGYNPGMAKSYYTAANPDYPDAGGVPYVETKWKPDPLATRDVEGAPGKAFGVDGDEQGSHLVGAYSSGVNLSGINLLDSASLNSAVAAVVNGRAYDGVRNHHAMRDANPTHLWEMNVDQDGRRAFAVKDGEGRVIASGSLDSTGKLLARSINELDARGNIVKSHPPVSCGYTPRPANCVAPSEYGYDAQSQMVWSREPDAGETRTFYDLTGRVRATQTQRQIDSGAYSVVGYDHLDRIIYTGEWRPAFDSGAARVYFNDVQNRNSPSVAELTPGTVIRTFYDRMPAMDTLGVSLYPADIPASAFGFTRNRVAAVVSDVFADGSGNVVRVSTANSYDKYGRVLASYTFDPTMPADSLKMLAVISEYDLGGKVTKVTKYPYGVAAGGVDRRIGERYTYDRLGRVDSIYVKNGYSNEKLLASYEYYPLGTLKSVTLGDNITVTYTYHISGAVKSATTSSKFQDKPLYKETLFYEDCGSTDCKPQYNGNVSQMTHYLAHNVNGVSNERNVTYIYDLLNRLEHVKDSEIPDMDEMFAYDAQGRIVQQLRGEKAGNADENSADGVYSYYENTNMLKSVAGDIDGSADKRDMSASENFVYDRDGNLIEDKSKRMTIAYDWRGMPVEFKRQDKCYDIHEQVVCDSIKLEIAYDGAGSRVSKTLLRKLDGTTGWNLEKKTHYTGIGSEIRVDGQNGTKVVVNMPQGLGRYAIESDNGTSNGDEFYLKNHLGSTMMVAKVTGSNAPAEVSAAYDYRAFGEQITLSEPTEKVTENFTGKERDDETALNYFGARYLDPMLGLWISVDPKRQFSSPYLYVGNGMNPVNGVDPDGNEYGDKFKTPRAARNDFKKIYNTKSIKENVEYATLFYETKRVGKDGVIRSTYSYTKPNRGTIDRVTLDPELPKDVYDKKHPDIIIEASYPLENGDAHTHSRGDEGYDWKNPSAIDIQGLTTEKGVLFRPDGKVLEYDKSGNTNEIDK
ncbi:MAG: DUF4329 domain-containing protein [Fibrobacter sp.]|nr:DUF4329 domain-containing protein [Fibrobacter sp.]